MEDSTRRSLTWGISDDQSLAIAFVLGVWQGAVNLLHSAISRTGRRQTLRGLTFSDHPDGRPGSVLQLPHPLLVLRHALPVILESVVAPFAAYDFVLVISGFRGAPVSALAWSYFLIGRRLCRHERVSTLLMLGTALLTLRTIVAFATDSPFVYFIQPTVSAFLASFMLVLTALAGRPFTQRFTHDFCPLTPELLGPAQRAPILDPCLVSVGRRHVLERGHCLGIVAHRLDAPLPTRTERSHVVRDDRCDLLFDHLVCSDHAS